MSGDYEFLCALYETSGTSGRYMHLRIHVTCPKIGKQPFFFCLVTLDDFESACRLRTPFVKRMLESMHSD